MTRTRSLFAVFFALAIALRVWSLNLPFIEPYNNISRQAIVASVAYNFYEHGFNFFYPEVNEKGRGPYLYNAEMPFYSYLMALLYRLAGGPQEWAARLVSVFFSTITLLLVYLFARRLYGENFALVAFLFVALSPLGLAISRSIQPEATMVFASTGAIFLYYFYSVTRQLRYFIGSALCLFLAIGTKFFNAYAFIPIFYIAWHRNGQRIFFEGKNYIYVLVACLPLVWYFFMWRAGLEMDLPYLPYRYLTPGFHAEDALTESFPLWPYFLKTTKVFLLHLLSPLGAFLFFVGVFRKPRTFEDRLLWVWLVSVVVVLIAGWKTVIQHPYYEVSLVPVCGFFVAKGFCAVAKRWQGIKKPFFLVPLILLEIASLFYYYRGLYVIPSERMAILEAAHAVESMTPKESLLLASYETGPVQLYYAHRRGWTFNVATGGSDETLVRELEIRRSEGAEYFVISSKYDFISKRGFEKYLRKNYAVMAESPGFALFDLRLQQSL